MFGLTTIQTKFLEYSIVLAIVFGASYFVYNKGYEAAQQKALVEQAQANKEAQDKYNTLEKELEARKNVRQQNARVVTKEVEKIVERPIYLNDCWDASGVSIANKAISGGNQSKPETTMPADKAD